MDKLRRVIMNQYQQYPKMEIVDFIKLFYQNSFGPLHMNFSIGIDEVQKHIESELKLSHTKSNANQIEYIGNQYYRVSIYVIEDGIITSQKLASIFYNSVITSPAIDEENIDLFNKQIQLLRYMIAQKEIDFDLDVYDEFIETYTFQGIRAVHHSKVYRHNYAPHYRVIHRDYLTEYLEV